jgi:tetratricopeptide (TPR) repeat protein
VVRAARLLGLKRDALRYRMRRYGIAPPTLEDLTQAPAAHAILTVQQASPSDGHVGAAPPAPEGAPGTSSSAEAPGRGSGWERKAVAVLAIEITWPEATAPETPPYEPWTVAVRWEQAIVEKVHGFKGVVLQRSPSLLLAGLGLPRTLEQQAQRAVHAALELEQLQRVQALVMHGRGQAVGIVGEAGVGKSRLIAEFLHTQPPRAWRILEARAAAYSQGTPYLPVIDLLKGYFQLADRDDPHTAREQVTRVLQTLDPALEPLLPALLALAVEAVGDSGWQALDPTQRRRHTLDACTQLLLRLSHVQPLLVVVEDLHWIDTETHGLLDHLLERLPTARCLLLLSYRPEFQHTWANKSCYTQLRLDPLPPQSAKSLLHSLLGDDPSLTALTPQMIERTQGNPFFLEESVHTLVEMGVLQGEPGAYRLAKLISHAPVPATVQAVLAARIDRLPPAAKGLLQTAAVIGTEVAVPLLQAIAELPKEALHRSLAHLQAAEFFYERALFPEAEYTFKHALTHEVAYESLLPEPRRALHAEVIQAIEGHYPDRLDEQAERLAHHAFQGRVWGKAVGYCRQAGAKAAARSAHRQAAAYFEQALQALEQLPESRETVERAIDLRCDLRHSLIMLAEYRPILSRLREAEALARSIEDDHRRARVDAYLAHCLYVTGALGGAIEAGQRASALSAALGDFALQVAANFFLGQAYHARGDYRRAIECVSDIVASLEGESLYERLETAGQSSVMARCWLSWCLAELGEFGEGRLRGEEGVRLAEAGEQPLSLMGGYYGLGVLYLYWGDFTRAIPILERGVQVSQGSDLPWLIPWPTAALGYAQALVGHSAAGVPLLEQALAQHLAMGCLANQALWLAWLSEAHLLAGRCERAGQLAEQALALADQRSERGRQAYARRLLGDIASQREALEGERAVDAYRQALALAQELGMRPLQAHCRLGLGKLYVRLRQLHDARIELSAAIDLYRAMAMTFWLPQAEAALAHATR